MNNKELLAEAISKLSTKELSAIYPPIERKNFVVRKSWLGRNQIISFTNKKGVKRTYNHDEVLKVMLPKLVSISIKMRTSNDITVNVSSILTMSTK